MAERDYTVSEKDKVKHIQGAEETLKEAVQKGYEFSKFNQVKFFQKTLALKDADT